MQLKPVAEAGLGYLAPRPAFCNTLSGGEGSAVEIDRPLAGAQQCGTRQLATARRTATGLHFDDIALLVKLLQRLVDEGHSLLVIEHNLEVIKCADWVIDLGPDGAAGASGSWHTGRGGGVRGVLDGGI